jgi:telomerase reverse transcriptase
MPKKGTFRPIITFNRRGRINEGSKLTLNLNQILNDTQLVLRNLKNILGQKFGYCVFDNRQVAQKYDAFVQKWRSKGCPRLSFFALDIKKCYDSINPEKLLQFIK